MTTSSSSSSGSGSSSSHSSSSSDTSSSSSDTTSQSSGSRSSSSGSEFPNQRLQSEKSPPKFKRPTSPVRERTSSKRVSRDRSREDESPRYRKLSASPKRRQKRRRTRSPAAEYSPGRGPNRRTSSRDLSQDRRREDRGDREAVRRAQGHRSRGERDRYNERRERDRGKEDVRLYDRRDPEGHSDRGRPRRGRDDFERPRRDREAAQPQSRSRERSPPRNARHRQESSHRDADRGRHAAERNGDRGQRHNAGKKGSRWSVSEPPQPNGEVWGTEGNRPEPKADKPEKEHEPNFGLSGALADETNKVNGVTLLYQEPPESASTTLRWRLYIFKGGELQGEPLYIHRQKSYLFGRERKVVDIPTDHPSCSKQHAVLQYRRTSKVGEDGMPQSSVRPYLMDLGSVNGTFINNEQVEVQRYYELMEKDVVKIGNSSREYVLLHDGSLKNV